MALDEDLGTFDLSDLPPPPFAEMLADRCTQIDLKWRALLRGMTEAGCEITPNTLVAWRKQKSAPRVEKLEVLLNVLGVTTKVERDRWRISAYRACGKHVVHAPEASEDAS